MTRTIIESKTKTVIIGFDEPFCVIGERINPTGRKKLAAELEQGNFETVIRDALEQVACGATVLDVIARIIRTDPRACFGFIAAAMLDETSDVCTRRFQLYTKMLELKVDPARYKVETLEETSTIFVMPVALANQPGSLQRIINRYDRIFRETF